MSRLPKPDQKDEITIEGEDVEAFLKQKKATKPERRVQTTRRPVPGEIENQIVHPSREQIKGSYGGRSVHA